MKPLLVVDVVGLSRDLLGPDTPHINRLIERGVARSLTPVVPAVTCSVQATFLTGRMPEEHGIVGNGWYFRELAEVWLWRQSNHLIQSPQIWELGRQRDPRFTSANLFWWYNMYSAADWSVTPRPMYPADGRELPDVYSAPGNLRDDRVRQAVVTALSPFVISSNATGSENGTPPGNAQRHAESYVDQLEKFSGETVRREKLITHVKNVSARTTITPQIPNRRHGEEAWVDVEFRAPLFTPGAARLIDPDRKYPYEYPIKSSVRMTLECPETPDQKLGIDYRAF